MRQKEAVVVNINDLNHGEIRQISVGETEILLSHIDGNFYAVGAHCAHYGAPLAEGALNGHHVVVDGDLQQQQFIAYDIKNNQVLAIASSHLRTDALKPDANT
ncbi:Rieske 2Fe-2S domain-containing protein [Fischerella sp. JS2]|uniref:Rieske 2Fe-2S domain-containing protein n=1 Tax=Fischerella sp. JS2 TaxID=2597771 RepID=UPI0028E1F43E|nr:Rieske 2Fe-2S domain-containing protein [Fischerella sp. JS2]